MKQNNSNEILKSEAYKALDPSEKSAISYFLGLTSAKLLASKFLNVQYLMHVDCLTPPHSYSNPGRSRPDLIGLDQNGDWIIIEAKGRSNGFSKSALAKAKNQTRHLMSINGKSPILRIALLSYFENDEYKIRWEDPSEEFSEKNYYLEISKMNLINDYYNPIYSIFKTEDRIIEREMFERDGYRIIEIEEADLKIGMRDELIQSIEKNKEELLEFRQEQFSNKDNKLFIGNDGILIELGQSWDEIQMKSEPYQREF